MLPGAVIVPQESAQLAQLAIPTILARLYATTVVRDAHTALLVTPTPALPAIMASIFQDQVAYPVILLA